MKRLVLTGMISLTLTACGDSSSGSDSNLVPTDVQAIFTDNCALSGCHAGSSPQQNQNLSESKAYANIVNVTSAEVPSKKRIAPSDTSNSYLLEKIKGSVGIVGEQMPLGGPYLTASEIDVIRQWILSGAPPRP